MYLKTDERGDFVVAREVNAYNMKGVPSRIPLADYVPVNTNFSGNKNFQAQTYNAANELVRAKAHHRKQMGAAQSANAATQAEASYRAMIAKEQQFTWEDPQAAILEEAINQSMSGADFKQLDVYPQERNMRKNFPATDFERVVCSLPIGHPQGTVPNDTPMWRNESMQPYGTRIGNRQMAGLWDDISGAISSGWDQVVDQGQQELVKAGTQELQQILGTAPQPGTPGIVPAQTASVIPVPSSVRIPGTTSSVNTKYLLWGGLGLGALVVVVLLLRR